MTQTLGSSLAHPVDSIPNDERIATQQKPNSELKPVLLLLLSCHSKSLKFKNRFTITR
jgi:hypothetical protein